MAIPDLMTPIEAEMDARGWTTQKIDAVQLAFTNERQYKETLEDGSANPQERDVFASLELVKLYLQGAKAWNEREAVRAAVAAVPELDL